MASTIGKNLNMCFTKIKRPSPTQSSLQQDHSRPSPNSTTTSILIKNFNSLYDPTSSADVTSSETTTTPDFATVFAAQRFFFASPGQSNSIIESSSSTSSSASMSESETFVGGGIAVPTMSPDPYVDFRRSMQEMVEARDLIDIRANWDYLQELLTCYLSLNPKSTHKFIVGAFADLLVSLMASPVECGRRESEFSDGGCKIQSN